MNEEVLPSRRRSWAALWSLLGTGAGHLYAGHARRGLGWFALSLLPVPVALVLARFAPSPLGYVLLLGTGALAIGVYVLAIVDAVRCARRAPRPYARRGCNQVGLYALLCVVALGWAWGGAALVRAHGFEAFRMAGDSMQPALAAGDRFLVNKASSALRRGDIIVFRAPDDPDRYWVKRVAGLPGDRIEPAEDPIPAGRVYVLGDATATSRDSRHFGPVSMGAVVGAVQYVLPGGKAPAGVVSYPPARE